LLGEYREDRTALLIYLCTLLHEAMTDLAELSGQTELDSQIAPDTMTDRFLTWARPRGR
jgi:hypothetical protein